MKREERLTDIPADEVDEKIDDFEFEGADTVRKIPQSDGKFTIIAIFEDTSSTTRPMSNDTPAVTQLSTDFHSSALGSGQQSTSIDTLARTLWGEARSETREGREAIASIILNRLKKNKPSRFGGTIEEVCRKPSQFSCWNDGDPNLPKLKKVDVSNPIFAECIVIAENAVQGMLMDLVLGADHYHTRGVSPDWSKGKVPCITIGNHLFFNDIA